MSDMLVLLLTPTAMVLFGLWRNAVQRETWERARAERLAREVDEKTAMLWALLDIDHAEDAKDQR